MKCGGTVLLLTEPSYLFSARTVNPVDAIYGIIKEMAGDASNVK